MASLSPQAIMQQLTSRPLTEVVRNPTYLTNDQFETAAVARHHNMTAKYFIEVAEMEFHASADSI